jgi:hypothetical protein
MGTFWKLLLITSSKRLEVRVMGLPSYGRDYNQLKNTLLVPGSQGGIYLPPFAPFSGSGARICIRDLHKMED